MQCSQMEVEIRELKSKLSSYVERAAKGEHVTITDRGRPVAMLVPPAGQVDLVAAAEAGWLQPATSSGLRQIERRSSPRRVMDVLGEDRNE